MTESKTLKSDLFGEIRVETRDDTPVIVRDCSSAPPAVRWLARWMLKREAAALSRISGLPGVPQVLEVDRQRLVRSFIAGRPLYEARTEDPAFYNSAMRLVRQLHTRRVVHNDLAKEPNVLVTGDGEPALIDFQIALFPHRRHWLFRMAAREDIRHMLKHKRTYVPDRLTTRERSILAKPSVLTRLHRRFYKPVYLFVTRKLLGWADREGAGDIRP